jgi:membrane protease subunit HflK
MANGYNQPPYSQADIDAAIAKIKAGFGKIFQKASTVLVVLVILWGLSGFFTVQPDQEAVLLVFGKYQRTQAPGLSWNWPRPIGETIKVPVTRVQKLEVGFRTIAVGPPARYQQINNEALMLTGDENIVSLEFIVQYRVNDPLKYLFYVRDPAGTLRDASESAMREVIGKNEIDLVLTEGKALVQVEAQKIIQQYMDDYDSGIQVVTVKLQDVNPPDQVNDAFKDVISAQQDKERKINEAMGFSNDVIPAARGEAAREINEAEAYREARVTEAQGEANRYLAFLKEYQRGKNVTKTRVYLETMEEILPKMDITILDSGVSGSVVPYMNVRELKKGSSK